MVADIVPEAKRSEGFGIMRVVTNLSWIIGPTVGGLLAEYSYLLLFIIDAITSIIVAVIVFKTIPETKPEASPDQEQESVLKSLTGYGMVFKDYLFVAFVVAGVFMIFGYGQIYNTLSVFLRDVHGLSERSYGFLMSANAGVGGDHSVLGDQANPLAPTDAVYGNWGGPVYAWPDDVRLCRDLLALYGCDDADHGWRDDRNSAFAVPGGAVRARTYARALYGNLWRDLGLAAGGRAGGWPG